MNKLDGILATRQTLRISNLAGGNDEEFG